MSKPSLSGEKYIVLETYKKNGEAVRTPVWFVEDDGTVYVRTGTKTGKMKRLRNNGRLKLAASNGRGVPKGPWLDAKYDKVDRAEWRRVTDQMNKKYGLQWRMIGILHRLQGKPDYVFLAMRVGE